MFINNLYNVQTKPMINTKSTYFSTTKQGSEVNYQQQEELKQNNSSLKFQNQLTDNQEQTTTSFNGYYDMFVASQALQNSEILNNCNHQMYMKRYA